MNRRDVIAGLLLAAAIRPARAQQTAKIARIAIVDLLTPLSEQSESKSPIHHGISEELRRLGYVEGRNLEVERYSSEGRAFHDLALIRDVIRRNPDVIIAFSNPAVLDFKAATSTIPIVGATSDPVALGIVASLARPGGNITGVSIDAGIGIWSKRLELLREVAPKVSKLGFLGSRAAWEGPYGAALREAAHQLAVSLVGASLAPPFDEAEYRRVLAAAVQEGVDALVLSDLPYNFSNRRWLVEFAAEARLPAIYPFREAAEIGGLVAYSFDLEDIGKNVADQVDRILNGTNPGDIPILQPTRFLLSINLKTAKALGLEIPASLLAQADEVIE